MNVNDIVCVGATPIAVVDYIAVEQADPDRAGRDRDRAAGGRRRTPGVEIPGGELAVIPELIRGHPSPHGFDLCATAVGTVALDAIVTGAAVRAGRRADRRAVERPALQRLHARPRVLEPLRPRRDARRARVARRVADALLEPTVIYVRAALDLLASDVPVHGLAHITGGGLNNLTRLNRAVGWSIEAPLPVPAVISLIGTLGEVADAEMWEVFNMGCGFVAVVPDRSGPTRRWPYSPPATRARRGSAR